MDCPYCYTQATYAPNEEFYGKRFGKSYMCYFCKPCGAYVGTHNNTEEPLGTMANKELRNWRKKAHREFDPIWKDGHLTRKQAYAMLERKTGLNVHMGSATEDICRLVINISKEYLYLREVEVYENL